MYIHNISAIGQNTSMATQNRNYIIVPPERIKSIVNAREKALNPLLNFLAYAQNETQITEGLYLLNLMIDAKVKGIERAYPVISRFNNTNSENIQTMLAGIYRKTLIPDAYGPLWAMLLRNSFDMRPKIFDPNEEIGGALLEYHKNFHALNLYSNK